MDGEAGGLAHIQLKSALQKHRETQAHGKYPDKLRLAAAQYARGRRDQGASVNEIADELGVNPQTADAWSSRKPEPPIKTIPAPHGSNPQVSLVPIAVRSEPARPDVRGRLEVELADGTRVVASGMGPVALVETVLSLRRAW